MGNMQQAVQAVQQYAASAQGKALGAVTGSALVRAAVAAGNVPGYPASWATHSRHSGQAGSAPMHALGRAVRQVPRSAGMGARANGHGTYASAAAAAKQGTGALVHSATAKLAAQQAAQGKQASAAKQGKRAAKRAAAPVATVKGAAA